MSSAALRREGWVKISPMRVFAFNQIDFPITLPLLDLPFPDQCCLKAPWLIHRLTYRRTGHDNIHVRGYKEEGTTTTPFDMCVLNDLDRFHLVSDVIDRVPKLGARAAYAKQAIRDRLIEHQQYISRYGDDMPEITGWRWGQEAAAAGVRSTEADNV